MVDGSSVGHADSEGDGGNVIATNLEGLKDGVLSDLKNGSGVQLSVVKDIEDVHLVLEGTDLELLKKSSLTGGDLVTGCNDLDGVNDLDLRLDNLGLDVKGLEERGLLGVHTGGTSWDSDINGGQ